jgi:hypothetical protein
MAPKHHVLPVAVLVELARQAGHGLADVALEGDGRVQQYPSTTKAVAEVEIEVLIADEAFVEAADFPGQVDAVQAVRQVVDVGGARGVMMPGVADAEPRVLDGRGGSTESAGADSAHDPPGRFGETSVEVHEQSADIVGWKGRVTIEADPIVTSCGRQTDVEGLRSPTSRVAEDAQPRVARRECVEHLERAVVGAAVDRHDLEVGAVEQLTQPRADGRLDRGPLVEYGDDDRDPNVAECCHILLQ